MGAKRPHFLSRLVSKRLRLWFELKPQIVDEIFTAVRDDRNHVNSLLIVKISPHDAQ